MEEMDREILEILRKALNQEKIEAVSDWPAIFSKLEKQAVSCLPYRALTESDCLSPQEKNAYVISCMQVCAYNVNLAKAQSALTALLQDSGVPFVVLKGAAASMYYPCPLYRNMGDIDLLVKPADFDRAFAVLNAHYTLTQTLEQFPRHAGFETGEGFSIELHRYFSFWHANKAFDDLLYRGIDARETHQFLGASFPALPQLENGTVLLYHIYQHLKAAGIGYRQVIDFREFLNSNRERIPEFLEMCETVQLRGLAEAMICICRDYLGLLPERDSDFSDIRVNPELETYLLELFISGENLGSGTTETGESKVTFVVQSMHNPLEGLRRLQEYGLKNWEAAKRHAVLRPFAWLYQLVRYLQHLKHYGGMRGTVKNFRRLYDKSQLFQDLGLQDT